MTAFVVVLAVGAGSYLFRVSMLVLSARSTLPPIVAQASRHAVPISFAALAATALASNLGSGGAAVSPMAAIGVGAVAVWRTGRPHAALVAGMPTLWLCSALMPA